MVYVCIGIGQLDNGPGQGLFLTYRSDVSASFSLTASTTARQAVVCSWVVVGAGSTAARAHTPSATLQATRATKGSCRSCSIMTVLVLHGREVVEIDGDIAGVPDQRPDALRFEEQALRG